MAEKDSCVTLDVHFKGTPELTVRWFHNGKDITDKKTSTRTITITETITTIIIRKITKKTTGRYEVVVTNKRGEAKTSTTVLIKGKVIISLNKLYLRIISILTLLIKI